MQQWADHQIFGKIKALELAWSRMNDATVAVLRAQLPECEFVGLPGDLSRYAQPLRANTAPDASRVTQRQDAPAPMDGTPAIAGVTKLLTDHRSGGCKMSIVQNYRNAKLLLNAARKSRAPLGKLGNANIAAAGQGDRTPPRAPSRLRERCSVAIRSLSFALKAVVVPQPRLFTVVNNAAYGYPLEEDPLGLVMKARWNDRIAELYSALTEQQTADHPLDLAPTPRQRLALERLQALADTWTGQGRSLLALRPATLDHLARLRPDDRLDMETTINALDFADEMSPELRAVALPFVRAPALNTGQQVSLSVAAMDA